jgi:hypothetical protein
LTSRPGGTSRNATGALTSRTVVKVSTDEIVQIRAATPAEISFSLASENSTEEARVRHRILGRR